MTHGMGEISMPIPRADFQGDGERNRPGCTVPRLAEWNLRKMVAHRKVSGATPDAAGGTPALPAQRLEFGSGGVSTRMPRRRRYASDGGWVMTGLREDVQTIFSVPPNFLISLDCCSACFSSSAFSISSCFAHSAASSSSTPGFCSASWQSS